MSISPTPALSAAARAFDAAAARFDERFGGWLSVAAQRRAVRAELVDAFPVGAHVLEIGGGTGEDALWLTEQGRSVFLTDAAPSMVRAAREKLATHSGFEAEVIAAEDLASVERTFDGAFSNFAALNCVSDLAPVARGLARLVRPGGHVVIVLFGIAVPGEWIVQLTRGDTRAMFRRAARGDVHARLGGNEFVVRYHRPRAVARAFQPWFRLERRRGIGVFVPPSAAEPWISAHPRLLKFLDGLDRVTARPLALLGDHILFRFERTESNA